MPRHPAPARQTKHEGQATVEFALVILLLFLMLFGIIDFARLFFAYATMSNGVREGARFAITKSEALAEHKASTEDKIWEHATSMMVLIGGDVLPEDFEITYPDEASHPGDPYCPHTCRVVIVATSDFPIWTPLIPNIQIEARATMHFE